MTDPANDLLHARLPCPAPGHWAVQLQECHEDHLHLRHAGVGPHQLDHVWFTGLRDVFRPQLPSPLTHRLIHPVRRKKASKRNRQSTAGDVYVVGGYREEGWDPANPGLSMPFVPLAAPLFLLGDVFEGYQQQDDPASVPILTPYARGGINPSPLWVVHGRPAFSRACAAVHGCSDWAIVLLLPAGLSRIRMSTRSRKWFGCPTCRTIRTSPSRRCVMAARWKRDLWWCTSPPAPQRFGGEDTTALDAIKSVRGCDLAWRPHAVYRPKVVLSPEITASSAASLGRVVQSPHSDVAWLEPHRYCWVPVATKVTSSDAFLRETTPQTWRWPATESPRGRVPSTARSRRQRSSARRHTCCTVHVVDASIMGAHLRRAQEAVYRGIKGPTSHLVNQHALSWIVEGLRRLPRRVGGPHH